jgi:DNA-binding MarR family transcriptional regulator
MRSAEGLFEETRLLFQSLRQWSESLHADQEMTPSMRGVLEVLLVRGAATVPEMARTRRASRQHIQQQVDVLLERGFLERQPNPAHSRSSMMTLADKGRAVIQNMRAEEDRALSRLQVGVSDDAVLEAARVLSFWRAALQRDTDNRAR